MVGSGSTTLLMSSEAWSLALSLIAILATSLLGAYTVRLRYRWLMRKDELEHEVRMAEQANHSCEQATRTYEISLQERQLRLQEKNADLAARFLEFARLDLEARHAELTQGEDVPLAAE
jgi:hypothetical protein